LLPKLKFSCLRGGKYARTTLEGGWGTKPSWLLHWVLLILEFVILLHLLRLLDQIVLRLRRQLHRGSSHHILLLLSLKKWIKLLLLMKSRRLLLWLSLHHRIILSHSCLSESVSLRFLLKCCWRLKFLLCKIILLVVNHH